MRSVNFQDNELNNSLLKKVGLGKHNLLQP